MHIEMGGQRKNSRHNLPWQGRDAPVSSWYSATCCHTELRNLLSLQVSQMRCSRTSYGVSTLLQVFETHRSSVYHLCTYTSSYPSVYQGAVQGQTKQAQGENTRKFCRLNEAKTATHTRVRVLASHANKVRLNCRSGRSISQPTSTRQLRKLCHGCHSSVNFEQKRQKTQTVGRCSQSHRVQRKARRSAQESRTSVTATLKTEACSFSTRVPPERPLHLESATSKVLTNFTLDTSSPCNDHRVKLRRS